MKINEVIVNENAADPSTEKAKKRGYEKVDGKWVKISHRQPEIKGKASNVKRKKNTNRPDWMNKPTAKPQTSIIQGAKDAFTWPDPPNHKEN